MVVGGTVPPEMRGSCSCSGRKSSLGPGRLVSVRPGAPPGEPGEEEQCGRVVVCIPPMVLIWVNNRSYTPPGGTVQALDLLGPGRPVSLLSQCWLCARAGRDPLKCELTWRSPWSSWTPALLGSRTRAATSASVMRKPTWARTGRTCRAPASVISLPSPWRAPRARAARCPRPLRAAVRAG